jgi:ribosomal protein S18 acetylase RimI-like enzyme
MQIAVSEDYRGTGLADRLVEDFLGEMRRRGAKAVSLGVERENGRAIAFYRRIGFAEKRPGIFEYELSSTPAEEPVPP